MSSCRFFSLAVSYFDEFVGYFVNFFVVFVGCFVFRFFI